MNHRAATRWITVGVVLVAFWAGVSAQESPEEIEASWLGSVTEEIRRAEYHFGWMEQGTLAAPNRAQGFRARFGEGGLGLEARTAGRDPAAGGWLLQLSLTGFGRGDSPAPVSAVLPVADENRVEFRRATITEWYVNDERGLKQGFELAIPPPGDRSEPVVLEMQLDGTLRAYPSEDGRAVLFKGAGGKLAVKYSELLVFDRTGAEVPASMEVRSGSLRLRIDDRGAGYPLLVDPLMTSADWFVSPTEGGTQFGISVATAGDVNGDGYSDVIVGAPQHDSATGQSGQVFVYLGSASGLSTRVVWTHNGDDISGVRFGETVACAGDVNGDGYDDVIVGATQHQGDAGRAFVFHGAKSGLPRTYNWRADSDNPGSRLGLFVGSAGDLDGDGYDEVIVGAPKYDNGAIDEGAAFVWFGGAGGLGVNGTPSNADWKAEGEDAGNEFGTSAAAADWNGDGYDDLAIGAPFTNETDPSEGVVFLWYGGSAGPAGNGMSWGSDGYFAGNRTDAFFGRSVGTAGDVDGDGYADLIVGADGDDRPGSPVDQGSASVYLGSATGLHGPAWTAESGQSGSSFGWQVGTAGDVNGDGYADVLVGAPMYANPTYQEGGTFAWFGGPGGLGATGTPANADWSAEGNQSGAPSPQFGTSVAAAGDYNGDGYSDVIVGAPFYDTVIQNEGRAFTFLGSAEGLSGSAKLVLEPDQDGAQMGWSVASAGDVNADGYSDVIVGANLFDNGNSNEGAAFVYHGSSGGLSSQVAWSVEGGQDGAQLGLSVASAGDVNGDGFGDVIVGAPHYTNGQSEEGKAWVYHGGRGGLARTPAWNAEGDQGGVLDGARFGTSVAAAGDVNGDGFFDVIVGAPGYDDPQDAQGRAYVFLGSPSGLDRSAGWIVAGDSTGDQFGISVASAGDVNGDGFFDVIVGAWLDENGENGEGRAFVFHGSPAGPSATADWVAEGDQPDANLGHAVAGAGDVNGDGFSDVIISAPRFDWGQADEGWVLVWHGSAGGLTAPGNIGTANWIGQINQADARFGASVASAGDVNCDGYSDVIIGADLANYFTADDGGAFLWYGSASGLGPNGFWGNEDWSTGPNQPGARFGVSVASAGDVNGDGFSDVLIGASGYDAGETDEGRLLAYYGNGGNGLARLPQQLEGVSAGNLYLLGSSDDDTFRLRMRAHSPLGRGHVRLEWEVELSGDAFDGNALVRGTSTDTGAPGADGSAAVLEETVTGLLMSSPYHWRVRVLGDSPLWPHSPWFTLAGNASTETDLRTGLGDGDGDGIVADQDCDDGDASVWGEPGEARNLFFHDEETIDWSAPADPGGLFGALSYDLIRSDLPDNFYSAPDCVASGLNDTETFDATTPGPGVVFHYLVRAGNVCGLGSLGVDSSGDPRFTSACP